MHVLNYSPTELVGDSISYRTTWRQGGTVDPVTRAILTMGTPINFTGSTAKLQLRVAKTDVAAALSLTQASGVFLAGAVSPNIGFDITAAQSTALGVGKWFYELQVTHTDGTVRTYMEGRVKLTQDTTR